MKQILQSNIRFGHWIYLSFRRLDFLGTTIRTAGVLPSMLTRFSGAIPPSSSSPLWASSILNAECILSTLSSSGLTASATTPGTTSATASFTALFISSAVMGSGCVCLCSCNFALLIYEVKAVLCRLIQRFSLWQAQIFAAPLAPDPILRYTACSTKLCKSRTGRVSCSIKQPIQGVE